MEASRTMQIVAGQMQVNGMTTQVTALPWTSLFIPEQPKKLAARSCKLRRPHLSLPSYNPLIAGQLFKTHRAAGVELLGTDANFGA